MQESERIRAVQQLPGKSFFFLQFLLTMQLIISIMHSLSHNKAITSIIYYIFLAKLWEIFKILSVINSGENLEQNWH